MKFIRYGILKAQKQVKYGDNKFHAPPCRYGLYAFPINKVDTFMLGATNGVDNSSSKTYWLRDGNGDKILESDFYDEDLDEAGNYIIVPKYLRLKKKYKIPQKLIWGGEEDKKDGKSYIVILKRPKLFTYEGDIWHHLKDYTKGVNILDESGTWIKTSMEVFERAFKKQDLAERCTLALKDKNFKGDITRYINNYCRDDYEVFIEKLK